MFIPAVCSPTCANGGTCTSPGVCTCPSYWGGSSCSTGVLNNCIAFFKFDYLAICTQPCQNGSTCIGGTDTCDCPATYTGSRCENSMSIVFHSIYLSTVFLSFVLDGCFHGKDMVNLVEGGRRSIENLQVGDRIWSINHDGSRLFEDEVFLMPDNAPNKISNSKHIL